MGDPESNQTEEKRIRTERRVLQLRLSNVLQREERRWGSFHRLADRIFQISGVPVDRRKLARIVAGENVTFRVSELAALDAYLALYGEGLAEKPLFEPSGILAAIASGGAIKFLLASDPIQNLRNIDISHWDVRSMIEVMREVQRNGQLQVDVEEVVFRSGDEPAVIDYRRENWYRNLTGQPGAQVCIGSPRVARASEIMLSEMFGVDPFAPQETGEAALPFYFFWPKKQRYFRSSFVDDKPSAVVRLPGGDKAYSRIKAGAMGLRLGEKLLTASSQLEATTSYGIIAAQRRHNGQIRLVLAGLSGPSTLAAARAVGGIAETIPRGEPNQDSPVLWAVVEASIAVDKGLSGERRLVRGQRINYGPKVWPGP